MKEVVGGLGLVVVRVAAGAVAVWVAGPVLGWKVMGRSVPRAARNARYPPAAAARTKPARTNRHTPRSDFAIPRPFVFVRCQIVTGPGRQRQGVAPREPAWSRSRQTHM